MNKILWGIVLIAIGVIIGTNSFGLTDINIFFDGWWTLFIIVPCLIGLFDNKEKKTGDIIGLIIGVLLLLSIRDLISFDIIAKLIVPAIFIIIGLSIIFNGTVKTKVTKKVKEGKTTGVENITATFSEQRISKDDESFQGSNLNAIFGSILLDLRSANLEKETIIDASSIFGSIEILVPKDVNIIVKSTPIFGGVSNRVSKSKDNKKTIYIQAFCMFGGIDIK